MFILFDTETTGLTLPDAAPLEKQPRIIEFGAMLVNSRGNVVEEFNVLVDPGEPITPEITKITGITNEDLAGQKTFSEILPDVRRLFSRAEALVAHNAPFDVAMLTNELKRIGCEDFCWPAEQICTAQEYTFLLGRRMKLLELYEHFVGRPLEQTHRALDDVRAMHEALVHGKFFE